MLHKVSGFVVLFLCSLVMANAQNFQLPKSKKFEKVKFQLINNLIIIPVEVNGTQLSFVLDSGVVTPILFNLSDQDSLQLNSVSDITINGLGEGEPLNALRSNGNDIRLGEAWKVSQKIYVILDAGINLSPLIGIPVHGIIGYDIFKDFVVDINYSKETIKLYDPSTYTSKNSKKREWMPISVINKKAYLAAAVVQENNIEVPVRMLLDTGSSDAVWLFENERIKVPDYFYDDFLGKGLSGDIYGKRTLIKQLRIGEFVLQNAKAAFPDMLMFGTLKNFGNRNGSLGGAILKRFNMVFDYGNEKIQFRKNDKFLDPFLFNVSGINLQHAGLRYISEHISNKNDVVYYDQKNYGNVQLLVDGATKLSLVPEIVVSGIRAGSPAHSAGIREGDIILAVNGKRIYRYKLQEILEMVNQKQGKRVKILVQRYNSDLLFNFVLKPLFE